MSFLEYFFSKIKSAYSTGTLWIRTRRFLSIVFSRPIEVVIGYLHLSKSDRAINVSDGFVDHRSRKEHYRSDPEHLRRIIAAYKAAKQAQPHVDSPFRIRGVWDEWININYKKLIPALESENIPELSNLYENLFREQFSTGTGGYDSYRRYLAPFGSLYIKYVWCSYRDKLLKLDFDLQKLNLPLIGNPAGVVFGGNVIPIETLRHAYHAVEMRDLLRDVPNAVIVEIGGGLGGQAYQTMKIDGQFSKYIIFDIPEVATISSYFLLSAFPEKRIRLYGEGPVTAASSDEYDLAVFPHFSIPQLSNYSVDLFYNSCSFSEMDSASSREYLLIIERACRKYFLHDNHDINFEFREPDGSVSVNIIGSELIPNTALFKRIFKKPRVHGLPEDRSFIQFEYLYQKI